MASQQECKSLLVAQRKARAGFFWESVEWLDESFWSSWMWGVTDVSHPAWQILTTSAHKILIRQANTDVSRELKLKLWALPKCIQVDRWHCWGSNGSFAITICRLTSFGASKKNAVFNWADCTVTEYTLTELPLWILWFLCNRGKWEIHVQLSETHFCAHSFFLLWKYINSK